MQQRSSGSDYNKGPAWFLYLHCIRNRMMRVRRLENKVWLKCGRNLFIDKWE